MGVEERQCEYCKCVASEYSIEYCDECDKYVCLNKKYPCDNMNVPEMLFDEISICGYCQLKKKLSDEDRKNFEDNEKDLEEKIKLLNEDLFKLYKQLGNL